MLEALKGASAQFLNLQRLLKVWRYSTNGKNSMCPPTFSSLFPAFPQNQPASAY